MPGTVLSGGHLRGEFSPPLRVAFGWRSVCQSSIAGQEVPVRLGDAGGLERRLRVDQRGLRVPEVLDGCAAVLPVQLRPRRPAAKTTWVAQAQGDLNGDGVNFSTFTLAGAVNRPTRSTSRRTSSRRTRKSDHDLTRHRVASNAGPARVRRSSFCGPTFRAARSARSRRVDRRGHHLAPPGEAQERADDAGKVPEEAEEEAHGERRRRSRCRRGRRRTRTPRRPCPSRPGGPERAATMNAMAVPT